VIAGQAGAAPISAADEIASLRGAAPGARSFGDALAAAIDGASNAIDHADGSAALVAAGNGDVVAASVARAKADVVLEIVSAAAARVSGALNALLQTQV
jgi:flagellar hook-basal body complex protein FliE